MILLEDYNLRSSGTTHKMSFLPLILYIFNEIYFTYIRQKFSGVNAISRLDHGSFDLLLAYQNMQRGIRDVTKKENNIAREGQEKYAIF